MFYSVGGSKSSLDHRAISPVQSVNIAPADIKADMIHGALPGKIGWHIGEPFAVKFAHDNSDMLFSASSTIL